MTLLLHTSTPTIRVGIADDDHVIARDEFPSDRQLASTLADRIKQLLHASRCTPHAVQRVAVHSGPGGFTSLRIGVTTANALAYALGIPIISVTGDVKDLEDLLQKSTTATPALFGPVTPTYAKEPDIGPIPHLG